MHMQQCSAVLFHGSRSDDTTFVRLFLPVGLLSVLAGLSFVDPKGICMLLYSKAHRCAAEAEAEAEAESQAEPMHDKRSTSMHM